jgi:hypothetical protein
MGGMIIIIAADLWIPIETWPQLQRALIERRDMRDFRPCSGWIWGSIPTVPS